MHATGLEGRIIEEVTNSETHHTVVAIDETRCVSAEWPYVIVRNISDYPTLVWSRFELTDAERAAIVAEAERLIGRPYNLAVLFVILFSRAFHVPVPKFIRDWLKRRRPVDCSELCCMALEAGGIERFNTDAALVVPGDFQTMYESLGWLNANQRSSGITAQP
ncbi:MULTISPECIES: hypothetical protein [Arthrobacter]|uniref:Uncharacterized protein n=1 Tax=Arthrobacter terricola TaxID=2547396 RepID=A0A4R5KQ64_9MICC|nr:MULTISPECIES: hypothetical protein [Arthrobacter]MBT8161013.1 hypothetical protein [Arthrobacter sp. GN70]TDF96877.1 hypothetical protein E1809_09140 [Arthrobacter terricola]